MWAPRKRTVRVQPPPLVQRSCVVNATTTVQKIPSTIFAGWSNNYLNLVLTEIHTFSSIELQASVSRNALWGAEPNPVNSQLCQRNTDCVLPCGGILKFPLLPPNTTHVHKHTPGSLLSSKNNYFISKDLVPKMIQHQGLSNVWGFFFVLTTHHPDGFGIFG